MEGQISADGALDRAALRSTDRILLDQPLDAFHAKAVAALKQSISTQLDYPPSYQVPLKG